MRRVLFLLLAGVAGCATSPKLSAVRAYHEELAPNDKVVLVRLAYQNPLRFAHSVVIYEVPADSADGRARDLIHLPLDDRVGDELLLLRLGAPGRTQLLMRLCVGASLSSCARGSPGPDVWITPDPSQRFSYAGRIDYRLADLFPDRGTRNFLTVKEFARQDAYTADTADAAQRWSFLQPSTFARADVSVRPR